MTDNFQGLTDQPTLSTVLNAKQKETFARLNCMRIGIIDEILVDNEVRCSITNKMLVDTNPDGSCVWQEYPPIFAKVWYMGSGETGINYPLTIGSSCLLLFNDREFSSYFKTGQVSTLVDLRMHSLTDCICIPLYRKAPTDALNLQAQTINLTATTINMTAETINVNGTLYINGQLYTEHTHSNGNNGEPTGGIT